MPSTIGRSRRMRVASWWSGSKNSACHGVNACSHITRSSEWHNGDFSNGIRMPVAGMIPVVSTGSRVSQPRLIDGANSLLKCTNLRRHEAAPCSGARSVAPIAHANEIIRRPLQVLITHGHPVSGATDDLPCTSEQSATAPNFPNRTPHGFSGNDQMPEDGPRSTNRNRDQHHQLRDFTQGRDTASMLGVRPNAHVVDEGRVPRPLDVGPRPLLARSSQHAGTLSAGAHLTLILFAPTIQFRGAAPAP